MQWYAETRIGRTRQIIADGLVLCWIVLWLLVGRWTFSTVQSLAAPADPLRSAGTSVQSRMDEVAQQVGDVPVVGDRLTGPFTGAADAGGRLVSAGDSLEAAVYQVAWLLAVLVTVTPVLLVVATYLMVRLRRARRAAAMGRLRSGEHAAELLALRSLVTQSPGRLLRIAPDPMASWQARDEEVVARLAALELHRHGLRPTP